MIRCKINQMGTKRWFDEEGKLHNENGPAVIYTNGLKVYYWHGKKHRLNGPAVIPRIKKYSDWFIDDKYYPEDSTLVKLLKARYG